MADIEIKACVFDAYGTLFDVHAPVARRLGSDAGEISKIWRQKQLEYTWLRSLMRAHADFWQVTADALDYALEVNGSSDPALRADLLQLYLQLDAFPDVRPCLKKLKMQQMPVAILSNGTPTMLKSAVTSAGLLDFVNEIISVEEVGVFKPDPRVYQAALERLHIVRPSEILFVSANTWDAQAAAHFGFQAARIDRFAVPDDRIPGRPKVLLKSLEEVPSLI
jgi:2-haloacid dehalogenase